MVKLTIIRGDDVGIKVKIRNFTGEYLDLTDGTLYFTVKLNMNDDDDDAKIQKILTTEDFDNPTTGIQVIPLTHDDTDLDSGSYWYDAEFIDKDGKIGSSFVGRLIVKQDITLSEGEELSV